MDAQKQRSESGFSRGQVRAEQGEDVVHRQPFGQRGADQRAQVEPVADELHQPGERRVAQPVAQRGEGVGVDRGKRVTDSRAVPGVVGGAQRGQVGPGQPARMAPPGAEVVR